MDLYGFVTQDKQVLNWQSFAVRSFNSRESEVASLPLCEIVPMSTSCFTNRKLIESLFFGATLFATRLQAPLGLATSGRRSTEA